MFIVKTSDSLIDLAIVRSARSIPEDLSLWKERHCHRDNAHQEVVRKKSFWRLEVQGVILQYLANIFFQAF